MVLLYAKTAKHDLCKILHSFRILFIISVSDEYIFFARIPNLVVKKLILIQIGNVYLCLIS